MQKNYCPKCDLHYWTPQTKKKLESCPFCSLGQIKNDNLMFSEKIFLKSRDRERQLIADFRGISKFSKKINKYKN